MKTCKSHNNSDLVSYKFDFMNFPCVYKSKRILSASHVFTVFEFPFHKF